MVSKGKFIGIGCLIAMLICLVNIVALCCICCHPSRTGSRGDVYSPMVAGD